MPLQLKEAFRALLRSPAFALTAILSLGIGIGATTSVFAVLNTIFFAAAPYEDSERLVEVWATPSPQTTAAVDYLPTERARIWESRSWRTVVDLAVHGPAGFVLEGAGEAESLQGEVVSGSFFRTLGVAAAFGRGIDEQDDRPAAERVAVLSDATWRDLFDGSRDVLGRQIRLSETQYVVVGVMPPSFEAGRMVWVPAATLPSGAEPLAWLGMGRLRPGVDPGTAAIEFQQAAAAEAQEDSTLYGGQGATALPYGQLVSQLNSQVIWTSIGVAGAIFLVALANLTSLFLVRAGRRLRISAIHSALGASGWRAGGRLVAEAGILGSLGALVALVIAGFGKEVLRSTIGPGYLPTAPVIDWRVFAFGVGMAVVATVLMGLEPLRALRTMDLRRFLQTGGGSVTSEPGQRLGRDVAVGLQVALSVVLVAVTVSLAAGLRTYTLRDVGYPAERLVVAVPEYGVTDIEQGQQWALVPPLEQRLLSHPSVQGVAAWKFHVQRYPPRPDETINFEGPDLAGRHWVHPWYYEVNAGLFDALEIELVRGRLFSAEDGPGSPLVAIVTEKAAEAWWPGLDPLGARLQIGLDGRWLTVVGTVEDLTPLNAGGRQIGLRGTGGDLVHLFLPSSQAADPPTGWRATSCNGCDGVVVGVVGPGRVTDLASLLRAEISSTYPTLPMGSVETMLDMQLDAYVGRQARLNTALLGGSAGVAVFLALIGIMGVVAEGILQRVREIGVRQALGARAHHVVASASGRSMVAVGLGLGTGMALLLGLQELLTRLFVPLGIQRAAGGDMWSMVSLAGAAIVVLLTALATSLLTARQALQIDPSEVLRAE